MPILAEGRTESPTGMEDERMGIWVVENFLTGRNKHLFCLVLSIAV